MVLHRIIGNKREGVGFLLRWNRLRLAQTVRGWYAQELNSRFTVILLWAGWDYIGRLLRRLGRYIPKDNCLRRKFTNWKLYRQSCLGKYRVININILLIYRIILFIIYIDLKNKFYENKKMFSILKDLK